MSVFGNQEPGVGTRIDIGPEVKRDKGFAAMGKPVPLYRQQAAYEHCKQMGLMDPESIWACVRGMAAKISRDEPMLAMEHAYRYLDVTGVYRLLAVLCTAEKPRVRVKAVSRRM